MIACNGKMCSTVACSLLFAALLLVPVVCAIWRCMIEDIGVRHTLKLTATILLHLPQRANARPEMVWLSGGQVSILDTALTNSCRCHQPPTITAISVFFTEVAEALQNLRRLHGQVGGLHISNNVTAQILRSKLYLHNIIVQPNLSQLASQRCGSTPSPRFTWSNPHTP